MLCRQHKHDPFSGAKCVLKKMWKIEKIVRVAVWYRDSTTDYDFAKLGDFTHLRSLHLYHFESLTDENLVEISRSLKSPLLEFTCHASPKITTKGIIRQVGGVPSRDPFCNGKMAFLRLQTFKQQQLLHSGQACILQCHCVISFNGVKKKLLSSFIAWFPNSSSIHYQLLHNSSTKDYSRTLYTKPKEVTYFDSFEMPIKLSMLKTLSRLDK